MVGLVLVILKLLAVSWPLSYQYVVMVIPGSTYRSAPQRYWQVVVPCLPLNPVATKFKSEVFVCNLPRGLRWPLLHPLKILDFTTLIPVRPTG